MSPGCGFIQPGQHQILTIGAVPTLDSPTEGFNLPLQLNADKFTKVPHDTGTYDVVKLNYIVLLNLCLS